VFRDPILLSLIESGRKVRVSLGGSYFVESNREWEESTSEFRDPILLSLIESGRKVRVCLGGSYFVESNREWEESTIVFRGILFC
jgi:predicted SpoU family rRNA methylase